MLNPILCCDYPDPDVIRVGDTYYMASTTMHFMPGGALLKSYDLSNWELAAHAFEILEDTKEARLTEETNIYGQGMWAPSLRYHKGMFYLCFAANDTKKTYLFTTDCFEGPWKKQEIEGFYHDSSLLFDKDRVFIVYGNTEVYITELQTDLSAPKAGGLHRMLVRDKEGVALGYEGSHIYKINNMYYLFNIHWASDGTKRRTQACFYSDCLEGEFMGGDVLDDDMGYFNQGVAQGGIVDTPEGDWYAVLFQDRGAVGRIPVLVPMHFEGHKPVFGENGKVPSDFMVKSTKQDYRCQPLYASDDFSYKKEPDGTFKLKEVWEWNHIPDNRLWSIRSKSKALRIRTDKISENLCQAKNILTQRLMFPGCTTTVTVDASGIKEGDYAGICALQGCFGMIALAKEKERFYLVMQARENKESTIFPDTVFRGKGAEFAKVPLANPIIEMKMEADFSDMKDEVKFFYRERSQTEWNPIGMPHKLFFKLDHFTGCRVGLFVFSTKVIGGSAEFSNFIYERKVEDEL